MNIVSWEKEREEVKDKEIEIIVICYDFLLKNYYNKRNVLLLEHYLIQ